MLCYRDQSYCSAFGSTCSNSNCPRAVTPDVQAKARLWWGSDEAPIAYSDMSAGCPAIIAIPSHTEGAEL